MSSGGHSGLLDMAPEKEKSPPCGIPASEESNHEETSSETHFDPFKKQKDCILHILILDNWQVYIGIWYIFRLKYFINVKFPELITELCFIKEYPCS